MKLLRRWVGRKGERPSRGSCPARWVVVDTETSGLDPQRDQLLAIGGIAVDDEGIRPADSFEVVLRNEPVADKANVIIHGIGHGAQRSGVPPREALAAWLEWAGDAPAVGFHADFDRAVFARAFPTAGLPADRRPWLDLAPLAAALLPEAHKLRRESLDDWLAAYRIDCLSRHNAAGDAFATAELLLRLRTDAARQGARGFDALVRVARQHKWLAAHH
jgi:DNA polymerase-3 subunit epsilon